MMKIFGGMVLAIALTSGATGQPVVIDTTRPVIFEEVIVTANRAERPADRVPVPVRLIQQEDIEAQGVKELSEILEGVLGMNLEYNRLGAVGVQMHGLDAGYVLVLIDGERVIGGVEGFPDLSRIPVDNIERIEIVHGPSSSLYGSEALAGVINIITKKTSQALGSGGGIRYGSNNLLDLSAKGEFSTNRVSGGLYGRRLASDGYDVSPTLPGPTVPPYEDYSLNGRVDAALSDATDLKTSGHIWHRSSDGVAAIQQGLPVNGTDESSSRFDASLSSRLGHKFSETLQFDLSTHGAYSTADARYSTIGSNESVVFFNFSQYYSELESRLAKRFTLRHWTSGGAGGTLESVEADFMNGDGQTATSWFAYLQHEWLPGDSWDIAGSLRLDAHSDYTAQLSPKLAVGWTPFGPLRINASIGRGFKAPTFEQRYINFTNPLGGNYTVLGSAGFRTSLQRLIDGGFIGELYIDPDDVGTIRPESSWSYNAAFELNPTPKIHSRLLVFRNDVTDLIETSVIGRKTDGESIFTYWNVGEVLTQGFETEVGFNASTFLSASVGYQYLIAKKKGTEEQLAGRSRHSGKAQITLKEPRTGVSTFVSGVFKSSYPYVTGTNIRVDGHTIWDVAVSKNLWRGVALKIGANNLFGHRDPTFLPSLSGTEWFVSLNVNT